MMRPVPVANRMNYQGQCPACGEPILTNPKGGEAQEGRSKRNSPGRGAGLGCQGDTAPGIIVALVRGGAVFRGFGINGGLTAFTRECSVFHPVSDLWRSPPAFFPPAPSFSRASWRAVPTSALRRR